MKYVVLWLAVVSLLLSGCNDSSSSSSGTSASSLVEEAIRVDASAVEAAAAGPGADGCEPEPLDEASAALLPSGLLMYFRDDAPTQLVVFAHGFGHTVEGSWRSHMRRFARRGVAVLATNYRDNFGFPALRGAHDLIAGTLMARDKFPSIETTYLLGVSMGGAVSGTAISEAATLGELLPEGTAGLYDYWIDVEGVSQLAETWAEAAAASSQSETAANAQAGIERDTGGTPVTCPEAYARRSPALHGFDMADAGIRAAAVIHAFNDGLVPYNQGREMATALAVAQIPTQFFSVTTVFPGQDPGTTGTESLGAGALDPLLNLAGHASEADPFHPVMRTAFILLGQMLNGTYDEETAYKETVIDVSGEYSFPPESE